jgi:hypothetical protein
MYILFIKSFSIAKWYILLLFISIQKLRHIQTWQLKQRLHLQLMRNIFLKCFNTYKLSDEASISDSYCLNNMKFSPRLYEIKLSQKIENVVYIEDCDLFIITEGDASRSCNFNTGIFMCVFHKLLWSNGIQYQNIKKNIIILCEVLNQWKQNVYIIMNLYTFKFSI